MSFICPGCDQNSLKISFALELPPSGDDDEITVQIAKCAACGLLGLAVYRESRHGSLDSESWHHNGYVLSGKAMENLMEALLACPAPRDRRCSCATHISLGKKDWAAVASNGIEVKRRFPMRWIRD